VEIAVSGRDEEGRLVAFRRVFPSDFVLDIANSFRGDASQAAGYWQQLGR
jgi:hypothetical protein